ncbi:MAG: restriction endonuclease subunit S [Bacteroidetes bacterium]|nr:restriction endonuclease subunit S [Bacteroidota bacterium]
MSWRKVKLGELVNNFSVRAKEIGGAENLEFLGVSNEEGITSTKNAAEDKAEEYKIIEKGCFAYNPYRVNVGSIGLMTNDTKGLISPAYVVFKPKPKSIQPELLLKFLKSSEGLRQIKLYARGTVRQALRFEDLCNIELSLPDYDTQNELLQKLNVTQNCAEQVLAEQSHQLELINKLRQQILKDAMQGKLVPQNPKDEPASKLLEKIKVEKAKSGKKEKALPKINLADVPFKTPSNWSWCRLGEIAELNGRIGWKGLTASEYKKNGPLFLSVYSLNYGDYVDYSQAYHISKERYDESPEIMLRNGDILICKDGAGIGKLGIIKDLQEPATINSSLLLIRPSKQVQLKFLYYYLLSEHFQKIVNSRIMGATTPHLYQRDLVEFFIALPPLSEQKRIVSKIEELMNLCDELEKSVKVNQEYTTLLYQTALKEALQPKTFAIKQEDFAIAAEPQPTYFSQKNLLDFYQKQIIGHIVKQHNEHKMQQGEMVIAKDLYHLEKLYGINTHFQFQNWHYGTYDNKIRQLINGKDKYFKKEKVGNKGYEVLALGEKSENLFNPKYHKPELDLVGQSMKDLLKIYATFPFKERSKRIELLNTVSKVISDTQSLDLATIREAMKLWKTPKAKFPTKADSFTPEETKECIDLILKQGWDKKLIL